MLKFTQIGPNHHKLAEIKAEVERKKAIEAAEQAKKESA